MIIGLAPIAGYTDYAYRSLCRQCGAELAYTEMASAEAIIRGNKKTLDLIRTGPNDSPLSIQIFGYRERALVEAAGLVEAKADFVDLNAGCPALDVVKTGAGSALLKDEKKLVGITRALVETCSKPVTVKIRLGWARDDCVRLCKTLDKAGVHGIAVHGRTAKQGYSGKADWASIHEAKKQVSCAIYGNGDIQSKAEALLVGKNLDGVLIGRAALGDPGVFGLPCNKKEAFLEWLELSEANLTRAKVMALAFVKGRENARALRIELAQSHDLMELKEIWGRALY